MPREPFLINPPKRRFKLFGRRSRKGLINPFRRRRNPFGEEVMLVGLNPFRSRRSHMFGNPFRRRRRKNKARRRHRRNAFLFNPVRRHRRNRSARRRRRNPMHRRYRRNPITSFGSAMSYLPTVGGAIGGMIAVKTVPKLLRVSGIPYYGVQAAVVVGGGWALAKVNSKVAEGFVIGSAATALYDVVKGFLGTTFSYLGLGDIDAYPLEDDPSAAYDALQDMAYQGYHDMI